MNGIEIIKSFLPNIPKNPGIYKMLDSEKKVLYVGKAKNLKNRILSYTNFDQLTIRIKRMVSEVNEIDIIKVSSETEALLLECNLIKELQPKYNVLLKDDKSFPFIHLSTDQEFPKISKKRGKFLKGRYFGPYADSSTLREFVIAIQKIFKIRNCPDPTFANRSRPCLQYDIKRCSAPCVGKISQHDYEKSVKKAIEFLKGNIKDFTELTEEKMNHASQKLEFEKAAIYRDQLSAVKDMKHSNFSQVDFKEADAISGYRIGQNICIQIFFFRYYKNLGNTSYFLKESTDVPWEEILSSFISQFYFEKKPPEKIFIDYKLENINAYEDVFSKKFDTKVSISVASGKTKDILKNVEQNAKLSLERKISEKESYDYILEELTKILEIKSPINRIEAYDNSHFQGKNPYGAMIVFTNDGINNGFNKSLYKKFSIKEAKTNDDYGMMNEVFKRRFDHEDWNYPDLIIIDGGKGQLSSVLSTIKNSKAKDIPILAISKGKARKDGDEKFYINNNEIFFENSSPIFYLLQNIRDESHRFAISSHRKESNKIKSVLSDIPGVGPLRKKSLIKKFGSVKGIKDASIDEIASIDGISSDLAKKINLFLKS